MARLRSPPGSVRRRRFGLILLFSPSPAVLFFTGPQCAAWAFSDDDDDDDDEGFHSTKHGVAVDGDAASPAVFGYALLQNEGGEDDADEDDAGGDVDAALEQQLVPCLGAHASLKLRRS